MTLNRNGGRRNFLRLAGGAAIAGLGSSLPGFRAGSAFAFQAEEGPPRIAVLFEPHFPGVDDLALSRETLAAALTDWIPEFLSAADLTAKLAAGGYALLVNPYGSAFPVECWPVIRKWLGRGGSLLNIGGAPFSVPVRRASGGWKVTEVEQASYRKELGITAVHPVGVPDGVVLRDISIAGDEEGLAGAIRATLVHEMYVKFTATRDYPQEDGTSGQRDALMKPLVGAYTKKNDMIAAPVVQIDRLLGEFSGGRWVFAAFSGTITADGLRQLVRGALGVPRNAAIVPTFACYYPGEVPAFRLVASAPAAGKTSGEEGGGSWTIAVTGANNFRHEITLSGGALKKAYASAWVIPASAAKSLRPGLYTTEAVYRPPKGGNRPAESVACRNGFWVYDHKMMTSGEPLEVSGSAFSRGGTPFPVTGTSYMSDGVQRKFLFEPNPAFWDRDFREMKDAGVNLVRTGIWTGWKNIMLDVGSMSEYPLRSLDAFLLCAQRHGIPVIFTFFAFLPESWGGANPYLDPRSVQAQKVFLSTIAKRYRECPGVIWDLINEPSFCSPEQLWLCRPNYDKHEAAAWKAWLLAGTTEADEPVRLGEIRERYRLTPGEEPVLPPLLEFRDLNQPGDKRLLRPGDYRLFAQEMFRRWTVEMTTALRNGDGDGDGDAGRAGLRQMVTVGQDEGGTYERPGPHFFSADVDFTSMHNWWYNDDLLWDSLMTTVHGKPNLIEETGVMTYEKADGLPWRSESISRDLLERKLGIVFGAGGAGYVHWLWNTNQYMDSDNEAGIGLKRPDASLKPEFDAVRQYALFFGTNAERLGPAEPEQAVMVIPHATMFSTRDSASEATRTAVRASEYHARIPLRTVSEFSLDRIGPLPKLLIFPSPSVIDRAAWTKLLALVSGGSTLVVSGALDQDRYLMPAGRSAALGVEGETTPVGTEEHLSIDGKEFRIGFRGGKLARIEKFIVKGGTPAPRIITVGAGKVIWCPVPVESGDSLEAVAALYRFAAKEAGLTATVPITTHDPSVLVRPVVFRDSILLAFVSEASAVRTIEGTVAGASFSVAVPPGRTVMRIHDRRDGSLVAELNPSTNAAF